MEIEEVVEKELSIDEVMLLSLFYLNKEFPFVSMTLNEVKRKIGRSKATAIKRLKRLQKFGLIEVVKDFINFYYVVKDRKKAVRIRKAVLRRLGFV